MQGILRLVLIACIRQRHKHKQEQLVPSYLKWNSPTWPNDGSSCESVLVNLYGLPFITFGDEGAFQLNLISFWIDGIRDKAAKRRQGINYFHLKRLCTQLLITCFLASPLAMTDLTDRSKWKEISAPNITSF